MQGMQGAGNGQHHQQPKKVRRWYILLDDKW